MRESKPARQQRAREILARLVETHPEARTALHWNDPLQLLVAVLLSAQCTDERVNRVTPALFARYPDAESLAEADLGALEDQLRSLGLFRAKARAVREAARRIVEDHGGQVPTSREALTALPGVGNKTAGVVAMHLSGEPALPVDTHVARLARRLGLSRSSDPDRIERDLQALLPAEQWARAHHAFIWHGRRICAARAPRCAACPVSESCPKVGVGASRGRGRQPPRPRRRRPAT